MLTDDMIHELQNENIIFQKEYTRQIYDTKSFSATGSYLKDSSVTYIKIKKETTGLRGILINNPVTSSDITLLNTLAACANMTADEVFKDFEIMANKKILKNHK